jgi:acyl-CoA synthetase (NDP forming)
VVLGLRDAGELAAAYADVCARLGTAEVEIQEMVEGGVEMLVGVQHDDHFGNVVVVGSGGILVELVGDSALRLPPVGPDAARTMIESLRATKMLAGFRGSPPADVDALVDVVTRVSELATDLQGRLESLDLNPVIVLPEGRGARIVDAVVIGAQSNEAGG